MVIMIMNLLIFHGSQRSTLDLKEKNDDSLEITHTEYQYHNVVIY